MSRQRRFHQLQIGENFFHFSRVLFELLDFEESATGKGQK